MNIQNLIGRVGHQRLLDLAFRIRPNSEFILSGDRRLTRRQVLANIKALAAGLQSLGIQKGDHVAMLLPACPESVYALFLPHFIGTVSIPLNPMLRKDELRHILRDCRAKVVIVTQHFYGADFPEMISELLPELPDLRYVLVTGDFEGDGKRFLALQDVLCIQNIFHPAKLTRDDVTRIVYTSGTTGWPKGVVHTREQAWGVALRDNRSRLDLMGCLLLPFPPFHFAGMFGIYISLFSGGKLILMERFNPQQMLELVERERVTHIGASPTVYRLMLGVPHQEKYDLSSVQKRFTNGMAASWRIFTAPQKAT
jgi:fatty-acyl-CoA synthase